MILATVDFSIMCSAPEDLLARIREAIDEVAAATHASGGGQAELDRLSARLAAIWAMIAELDPALAARLPGYCTDSE